MTKDKTVNINNFIGVYDNYIPKQMCDDAINLYEKENKFNHTVNRLGGEQVGVLEKQDQQLITMIIITIKMKEEVINQYMDLKYKILKFNDPICLIFKYL